MPSTSSPAIILDKKLLSEGLYTLLEDLSTTLTTNHDAPTLLPHQLVTSTEILSAYVAEHYLRNHRRSKAPLDPPNLSFHSLRTRNPAETTVEEDENGVKTVTKGEKNWYYLVLSETEQEMGDVQILAEGALRKDKGELLDGFNETVKEKIEQWGEAMKEKERKLKAERGKKMWEVRRRAGKQKKGSEDMDGNDDIEEDIGRGQDEAVEVGEEGAE